MRRLLPARVRVDEEGLVPGLELLRTLKVVIVVRTLTVGVTAAACTAASAEVAARRAAEDLRRSPHRMTEPRHHVSHSLQERSVRLLLWRLKLNLGEH